MNKKSLPRVYSKYAILVLSCDKYSDMWDPFFSQLKKLWPTCPYNVYLGSNSKIYNGTNVTTILSGKPADWSTDLRSILAQLNEEYIFIWVEDFLLTSKVDAALFLRAFEFMKANDGNHMHMSPVVKPDKSTNNPQFGAYEKGAPYRINVCGFWNRLHLESLLLPGENPWKFEIMGSYRSSYFDGYYTVTKPLFELIRVIEKGKITGEAYEYCTKHDIQLDLSQRDVYSLVERKKSIIQDTVFQIVLKIPWKIRVHIMNVLRRVLISY